MEWFFFFVNQGECESEEAGVLQRHQGRRRGGMGLWMEKVKVRHLKIVKILQYSYTLEFKFSLSFIFVSSLQIPVEQHRL